MKGTDITDLDTRHSLTLGAVAVIAGVFSAFGSFMIHGSSVWFDPPGWLLAGLALFVYALVVLG